MISPLRKSIFDLATSNDFTTKAARCRNNPRASTSLDQIIDDTNAALNSILLKRAPSNIDEICFDLAVRHAASILTHEDIDCMGETIIQEIDIPSANSEDVDRQFYDLSISDEPIANAQGFVNHMRFAHSPVVDLVTRLLAFSIQLGHTA